MIIEIVRFGHPAGDGLETIRAQARGTVDQWRANPDLVRKHFFIGEGNEGGAVYVWSSRAAAEKAHDRAWREAVKARTGSEPTSTYLDIFMVIDNEKGTVDEFEVDGADERDKL